MPPCRLVALQGLGGNVVKRSPGLQDNCAGPHSWRPLFPVPVDQDLLGELMQVAATSLGEFNAVLERGDRDSLEELSVCRTSLNGAN